MTPEFPSRSKSLNMSMCLAAIKDKETQDIVFCKLASLVEDESCKHTEDLTVKKKLKETERAI